MSCEKSLPGTHPDLDYKPNNNSYNTKDAAGKRFRTICFSALACITLFAACLITFFFSGIAVSKPHFYLLLVSGIAAVVASALAAMIVIDDPIVVVYAASELATRLKRTPPVMGAENDREKEIERYFETHWREISNEVMSVVDSDTFRLTKDTYGNQNIRIGNDTVTKCNDGKCVEVGWKILPVSTGNTISEYAQENMPALTKALKKYNSDIISCAVSKLPARTTIPPHIGYSSFVKRFMVAIEVPKDRYKCYLCVNGKKVLWTEGHSIFFDDTYCHSVYNKTNERRTVLYMDIRRRFDNTFVDWVGDITTRAVENHPVIKHEIARTEQQVKN
jgi:hypothetical protein